MSEEKLYLGDGVYMAIDEWDGVVLTTSDGITTTNRIILEREVYAAMITLYARNALRKAQEHQKRREP